MTQHREGLGLQLPVPVIYNQLYLCTCKLYCFPFFLSVGLFF